MNKKPDKKNLTKKIPFLPLPRSGQFWPMPLKKAPGDFGISFLLAEDVRSVLTECFFI